MARRRGKRAAAAQAVAEPSWNKGDRVSVDFDGVPYQGVIMQIKHKVAVIAFDDGDTQEIDLTRLAKAEAPNDYDGSGDDSTEDDPPTVEADDDGDVTFRPPPKGSRGMHVYPVTWDQQGINFKVFAAPDEDDLAVTPHGDEMIARLKGRMVEFYGWWRKTNFVRVNDAGKVVNDRVVGYSIDMYARVQGEDKRHEYLVESLKYEETPETGDPRSDMHALNSDICVAIRKWFFVTLKGDRETIEQLRIRADRPRIQVPSLQWLDTLLLKAREIRDTALRSGGQRSIVLQTDNADDPVISLDLDFTSMAVALEGKVPNLYEGTMHEQTHSTGGRKSAPRARMLEVKMDPQNLTDMAARVKELNALAKQGDKAAKSEARKIRAILRQHGHKGGARSAAEVEA